MARVEEVDSEILNLTRLARLILRRFTLMALYSAFWGVTLVQSCPEVIFIINLVGITCLFCAGMVEQSAFFKIPISHLSWSAGICLLMGGVACLFWIASITQGAITFKLTISSHYL